MENQNEKRKRAVEINFDIEKFKEQLIEELKSRMEFKCIGNTIDALEIAIALHCMGLYAKQAPCNIMLTTGGSGVENCIDYDQNEDKEKIEKEAAEKIEENMRKKIEQSVKNPILDILHKTIRYGGNAEFSQEILVVFGIYHSKSKNENLKYQLYKKLILDFFMQTINNMSDFNKFGQDNNTFWEEISYNFIENYKKNVFGHFGMPAIELTEQISRSPYENRECRGSVIFASSGKQVKDIIKLDSSYDWTFKDTEFVRKMLEIATEDCCLFVQTSKENYRIQGFCLRNEEDIKKQKVYLRFWGNFSYSVFSMGEEILRCENGIYYPTKEDVEFDINQICVKNNNIPGLKGILQKREKIKHGAIYIFAEDAENICQNLCKKYNRGTVVETFNIDSKEDFFLSLSAVDGAVLADLKGHCYAYGVILDGEAKVEADLTRGSRYNSAKNYVYGAKRLAVVISEDKEKKPDIIAGWEQSCD